MCCGTCGCRRLRENIIRCISSEESSDLGSILIAKSAVFISLVHRIKNCVTICHWNWKQAKGEFLYCWRPPVKNFLPRTETGGKSREFPHMAIRSQESTCACAALIFSFPNTCFSHMADIGMQFRLVCKYILLRAKIRTKKGLAFKQLTNTPSSFFNQAILWYNHCYAKTFRCPGQLKRWPCHSVSESVTIWFQRLQTKTNHDSEG